MINFLESKLTIALEQRLQIWADWFSHGNRIALGYPPVSITYWACYQMPKQKVGKQISALPAHAEAEGIEHEANDYKPGALLQSPKHMLKNARVWERGFSQFDYSLANANTFLAMLKKNKVPDAQFADALK